MTAGAWGSLFYLEIVPQDQSIPGRSIFGRSVLDNVAKSLPSNVISAAPNHYVFPLRDGLQSEAPDRLDLGFAGLGLILFVLGLIMNKTAKRKRARTPARPSKEPRAESSQAAAREKPRRDKRATGSKAARRTGPSKGWAAVRWILRAGGTLFRFLMAKLADTGVVKGLRAEGRAKAEQAGAQVRRLRERRDKALLAKMSGERLPSLPRSAPIPEPQVVEGRSLSVRTRTSPAPRSVAPKPPMSASPVPEPSPSIRPPAPPVRTVAPEPRATAAPSTRIDPPTSPPRSVAPEPRLPKTPSIRMQPTVSPAPSVAPEPRIPASPAPASTQGEADTCPECGVEVATTATYCTRCGASFAEDADSVHCAKCGAAINPSEGVCTRCETRPPEAGDSPYQCSECGGAISADAEGCPHCGAEFDSDDMGYECPQCGNEISADADECPKCGAQFE